MKEKCNNRGCKKDCYQNGKLCFDCLRKYCIEKHYQLDIDLKTGILFIRMGY